MEGNSMKTMENMETNFMKVQMGSKYAWEKNSPSKTTIEDRGRPSIFQ